jgi:hypothetical protein
MPSNQEIVCLEFGDTQNNFIDMYIEIGQPWDTPSKLII